jgi:hypothetical protein
MLAAMRSQKGIGAPAAAARLEPEGIVVRIHGDDQYRLESSLRSDLEGYDHRLVDAVRANDDAAYHAALGEVIGFVKAKGVSLGAADMTTSEIILPSEDMSLNEVTTILEQENWMQPPVATA